MPKGFHPAAPGRQLDIRCPRIHQDNTYRQCVDCGSRINIGAQSRLVVMKPPSWVHFTLSTYGEHPRIALAMLLVIVAAGGRRAAPLADYLSSRTCTVAIRAAHDLAQASGFRACHPSPADGHPELPAVGTFFAKPAAGHSYRGTPTRRAVANSSEFKPDRVAEPDRALNVTVPGPEFTGSDRLRRLAAIAGACVGEQLSRSLLNLFGHRQEPAISRK